MFRSVLLILIPLLTLVACGNADNRRYPYQVSIRNSGEHICGGVIIQHATILTAGHCVHNRNPSDLSIRAGSHCRTTGGTVVRVRGYRIHPQFNLTSLNFDLAVVYLKTPLFFNSKISSIPLNTNRIRSGSVVVATGWGASKEGGQLFQVLKRIRLRTVSPAKCRQLYGKAYRHSMFCAESETEVSDTCRGDSGGPVVSNRKVIGITSHGNGCGRRGWPGMYTSVPYLRRWINKVT